MSKKPSSSTADRRRTERQMLEAPVRLRFDAQAIAGVSDNLSSAGALLFTDQDLRVVVEVDREGEIQSYRGRLIRAQRMGEETTGLAIEFDPEDAS